jgi:hypothetical protein
MDHGRRQDGESEDFVKTMIEIVHDDKTRIVAHFHEPNVIDGKKGGQEIEKAQSGWRLYQNIGRLKTKGTRKESMNESSMLHPT